MSKLRLAFVALAVAGNAHAVSMSLNDGCGPVVSMTGIAMSANPAGDLTLSTGNATPYSVLGCDTSAGVPRCTLSASSVLLTSTSGSTTLVAKCSSSPTAYNWVKPAGWGTTLSGATAVLNGFPAPGSYTFAVSATNGSGTGTWSNPITILVAAGAGTAEVPHCIVTASPALINPGQSTRLHATCNPAPATYAWTVDNGSVKPTSTQASADIQLNVNGTYTFDVKGVTAGAQAGPMASATVTVNGTDMNVAAASAGGSATASSFFDVSARSTINGERAGATFGAGGVYSSKVGTLPDGFYVGLATAQTVDRVILYAMQDDYEHPVEPTDSMTFQYYGAKDFEVYAYNDAVGWQLLATVTNNNLVKKQVSFTPVTTGAIMIKMLAMGASSVTVARATELELYSGSTKLTPLYANPNAGAAGVNDQTPQAINNGDRKGVGYGAGGVWTDSGVAYPDWARVDFTTQRTINRVVIYGMQDDYTNPVEPTDTLACSLYCVQDFQVQTLSGNGTWVTQATITGNALVKRTIPLAVAVTTSAVRIYITKATNDRSRLAEVEAWGY